MEHLLQLFQEPLHKERHGRRHRMPHGLTWGDGQDDVPVQEKPSPHGLQTIQGNLDATLTSAPRRRAATALNRDDEQRGGLGTSRRQNVQGAWGPVEAWMLWMPGSDLDGT